jgi:hypothetical protein
VKVLEISHICNNSGVRLREIAVIGGTAVVRGHLTERSLPFASLQMGPMFKFMKRKMRGRAIAWDLRTDKGEVRKSMQALPHVFFAHDIDV